MKILFIAHKMPYPPNKGEKVRAFNIIRHLSRSHEICLVSLCGGKDDRKYEGELKKFCKEVHLFAWEPFLAGVRAGLCLLLGIPATLGYFYSSGMKKKIGELINSRKFDRIFVYSSSMAQYVTDAGVAKIMDFVDCDSAKWLQYSKIAFFPMSFIYAREHELLRDYEKRIAQSFDRSIVVTEAEKREFAKFVSTEKFSVISNGVDTEFFKPIPAAPGNKLVFTGAMDYFANIDGVIYFCRDILPLVKRVVPDVKFYIVGSRPARSVRALDNGNDVIVTGFVDDIREYLKSDAVSVVPLRVAQGIQNKILEAMASGLAVVATSKAAAALKEGADKNIAVADTAESFAGHAIRLLGDDDLRRRMGELARKYAEDNYSWQVCLSRLDDIIRLN